MSRRSDVNKGEFSPTGLEKHMSCPRQFFIQKLLTLSPKGDKIAADWGSAFHEAVALMWKDHKAKASDMLEKFAENWKHEGDNIRNIATAMVLVPQYYENCHNLREFVDPKEVEVPFELVMPNGTTLIGVIDYIMRRDKMIMPHDIKTTGSYLNESFWARYANSFQMGAYYYACKQLLGQCDNITVDAVGLRSGKTDKFSRRAMLRTELQQEEWMHTYLTETNSIMAGLRDEPTKRVLHFPQRPTSCTKFMRACKFMGACKHGLDHPSVIVDLEVTSADIEED